MAVEVISCPNCGASNVPLRYSSDYVPCPYCGSTIRVTDRRPNTTEAFQERIERERGERSPPQEQQEQQTLWDLLSLKNKARRGAVWLAALVVAAILSTCALSLLITWLKQGEGAATKPLIASGVFAAASVAAWVIERRMHRRFRRTPGLFR